MTNEDPTSNEPRTVYVSYAWADSSPEALERREIVDALCGTLRSEGWNVVHDQVSMHYGDLITSFTKKIARADRIILVLSDKYLRSPWCMAELHGIYQRSIGDKDAFLERVIPLTLSDAKFSSWRDRAEIARYWKSEFEEMKKNIDDLGTADLCLYKAMRDWHNNVGDILAHVSDVLRPIGFDTITKDEYAGLKMLWDARQN
jgi:internalin A